MVPLPGTTVGALISLPEPRQLPRVFVLIAFVPAGNNRVKTLVPHRLNTVAINGPVRGPGQGHPVRSNARANAVARLESRAKIGIRRSSLRDNAVGPLDEAHKNRGVTEFRSPLRYIRFRDPTGPAAGSSSEDRNALGHNFFERLAERGPAHGHDGVSGRFAHQRGGFAEQENLYLVARFREREPVMKWKRGLGGIIGAPGTLHHDLKRFLGLLGLCTQRKKRQSQ
jgi:hypothetical protein